MRALAIFAAIAMIVSIFLSWTGPAIQGLSVSPSSLIRALDPDIEALRAFISTQPVELVALLASFALAALFLVLVLFNLPSRLVAILCGGTGVGLIGWTFWSIRAGAPTLPVPVDIDPGKATELLRIITELAGPGALAWAAGAALLLLCGLIGWERR